MIFTISTFSLSAQGFEGMEQSNRYVRNTILEQFGRGIYNVIFEEKIEDTNNMFESFKKNPNLERLSPNIQRIQQLVENGLLVLMIFQNNSPGENGHIAFVGTRRLELFSIPPIPGHEGEIGTSLPDDELVLVQAGYYTGIVSIRYVINGWNNPNTRKHLLENSLYFYTIKRR
jgi:hypothetical protein